MPGTDHETGQRLMLLDTASLYFRAFFGVPDTMKAADGTPTNAIRGLLDFIARLAENHRPTHLVACWDDNWRPSWRVALIPSYKAQRVEFVTPKGEQVEDVPDRLEVQVPYIRACLEALGIAIVGAPDHEADDVIGTLSHQATMPVDVVTGDRDLFQLIDDSRASGSSTPPPAESAGPRCTTRRRCSPSTKSPRTGTPTSPRSAVTPPTACQGSRASARRRPLRSSRRTATWTRSAPRPWTRPPRWRLA